MSTQYCVRCPYLSIQKPFSLHRTPHKWLLWQAASLGAEMTDLRGGEERFGSPVSGDTPPLPGGQQHGGRAHAWWGLPQPLLKRQAQFVLLKDLTFNSPMHIKQQYFIYANTPCVRPNGPYYINKRSHPTSLCHVLCTSCITYSA